MTSNSAAFDKRSTSTLEVTVTETGLLICKILQKYYHNCQGVNGLNSTKTQNCVIDNSALAQKSVSNWRSAVQKKQFQEKILIQNSNLLSSHSTCKMTELKAGFVLNWRRYEKNAFSLFFGIQKRVSHRNLKLPIFDLTRWESFCNSFCLHRSSLPPPINGPLDR